MIIALSLAIAVVGAFIHILSGGARWLGLVMFGCGLMVFLLNAKDAMLNLLH